MTESPWLVAVAIVAATNPPRLSPTLARLGGDSTSIRRRPGAATEPGAGPGAGVLTGAGALGALAVLVILAWTAPALLEAIDVSAPTMRVAAGLVLIAAAVRNVLVEPPGPTPALPGWGGALVPVAVPLVLRPELGVLAVSAGAVEGVGLVGLAALVTLVLVVLAVMARGPVASRVMRWAAWLATAATLTVGVALTVEGIYGV